MCGIFALLNSQLHPQITMDVIQTTFKRGKNRGPESSKLVSSYGQELVMGFHRLAINGLNEISNQPLVLHDIELICNGEIYNYHDLYKTINVEPTTGSDCEIIIHLYRLYGMEHTLTMLDGVFAFVLYDRTLQKLFVARDPYGVRPLYTLHMNVRNNEGYTSIEGFASELKMIEPFYNLDTRHSYTKQFEPGTYSIFTINEEKHWTAATINQVYHIPCHTSFPSADLADADALSKRIVYSLKSAVAKRCNTTERPVACLLSGGLDSSLIAALVADYFRTVEHKQIETYSIGLAGSEDLAYARKVADYINSDHTEIVVTEKEMFQAIPEVIRAIESYDTTTVRASIGNYLLGKHIATHSHAKVIFNGDGSDELFGGYLYMNYCPDDISFDKETRRLLKDIHLFDVLRSDKSISSNGLEPRTPFLDKTFVDDILRIPIHTRNHTHSRKPEKFLLRNSFRKEYCVDIYGRAILPDEILWRTKEAFSDGVSSHGRSLFVILQEHIANHYNIPGSGIALEKQYYRELFDKMFPSSGHIVPYMWMPKFTDATDDPSARTLDIYKNKNRV